MSTFPVYLRDGTLGCAWTVCGLTVTYRQITLI